MTDAKRHEIAHDIAYKLIVFSLEGELISQEIDHYPEIASMSASDRDDIKRRTILILYRMMFPESAFSCFSISFDDFKQRGWNVNGLTDDQIANIAQRIGKNDAISDYEADLMEYAINQFTHETGIEVPRLPERENLKEFSDDEE